MNQQTLFEFKCANCKVPLQGPADPKPDDRIACPICGEGDRLEQVIREIGEYTLEKSSDSLARGFERALRGNKHVKFTKHPIPKKPHRFIVDLGLQ